MGTSPISLEGLSQMGLKDLSAINMNKQFPEKNGPCPNASTASPSSLRPDATLRPEVVLLCVQTAFI